MQVSVIARIKNVLGLRATPRLTADDVERFKSYIQKTEDTTGKISITGSDGDEEKDYDDGKALEDALRDGVTQYRCVRMTSNVIGSIPLIVERETGDKFEPDPQSDLQKLLRNPNKEMHGRDWQVAWAVSMMLTGKQFTEKVRAKVDGKSVLYPDRGLPAELYSWPSDDVTVYTSSTSEWKESGRWLKKYKVGATSHTVWPEEMIYSRELDPSNPAEGIGPYEAAYDDAKSESHAREWNKSALANSAVPSGIITPRIPLNKDQWELFETVIAANVGPKNARSIWGLGADAEFKQLSMNAQEMDWANGRKLTSEKVATAFGVSPILLGDLSSSTFANYALALEDYFDNTIKPMLEHLLDAVNYNLAREFGSEYRVIADTSGIKGLVEEAKRKAEHVAQLTALGIPLVAASEMAGLELPEYAAPELDPVNLDRLERLVALGMPVAVASSHLELGLPPFKGDDVGLVASSLVPVAMMAITTDDE